MGVWWHALAFVTHERAKMSHKPGRNLTQAGPKCHTRAKMSHSHVIMLIIDRYSCLYSYSSTSTRTRTRTHVIIKYSDSDSYSHILQVLVLVLGLVNLVLAPALLSYYSDLMLSQAFQPMAVQISKKVALPLAKILATASCRSSKTGPWAYLIGHMLSQNLINIGSDSCLLMAPSHYLNQLFWSIWRRHMLSCQKYIVCISYILKIIQWNLSVMTTSIMKSITCDLFSNVF